MSEIQFNLNINRDDASLNDFLFCWSEFKSRPNKMLIYNTYLSKDFNDVLSHRLVDKNTTTEIIPDGGEYFINDRVLAKINDGLYLSYVQIDRNCDRSSVNDICFFYKGDDEYTLIQEIIDEFETCIVNFLEEGDGNRVNTISIGANGLEIDPLDIPEIDFDTISNFYNKETFKSVKNLSKAINKSKKGISVLYGERGTGKTSIINYISSLIDRMVLFIPNNMIDVTINNPEFKKLLRRFPNPLIIIDDCEMMFNESFTKSNVLLNNLLQLTDGFLSDSIEVQIILIFNVDSKNEIDHILLESNNLVDLVKFDRLSKKEATRLSKQYISQKYKTHTKVIDVVKNRQADELFEMGI